MTRITSWFKFLATDWLIPRLFQIEQAGKIYLWLALSDLKLLYVLRQTFTSTANHYVWIVLLMRQWSVLEWHASYNVLILKKWQVI